MTLKILFVDGEENVALPIVRQHAGLLGGQVWVDSAVGRGSCLTLVLPLVAGEALDTVPAAPPLTSVQALDRERP
jgi:hypothetical protein